MHACTACIQGQRERVFVCVREREMHTHAHTCTHTHTHAHTHAHTHMHTYREPGTPVQEEGMRDKGDLLKGKRTHSIVREHILQ